MKDSTKKTVKSVLAYGAMGAALGAAQLMGGDPGLSNEVAEGIRNAAAADPVGTVAKPAALFMAGRAAVKVYQGQKHSALGRQWD